MEQIVFLNLEYSDFDQLTVVTSKDHISRNLDGEEIILNLSSGVYCGLNEVGSRIWALIQEPRSVKDILNTLLKEYNVKSDKCERELLQLLQQLSENDLIDVSNEKSN